MNHLAESGFTIDKSHDIPIYSPVCSYCKHLNRDMERKCKAFPDGIPMEIWKGENNHRETYPGDKGGSNEEDLD